MALVKTILAYTDTVYFMLDQNSHPALHWCADFKSGLILSLSRVQAL